MTAKGVAPPCALCDEVGGELVWQNDHLRVVLVEHERFPGFCRVVWKAHVAELGDLSEVDRQELMQIVCVVESAQRQVLAPDKINLASLGNVVPHLHWHVIPRYCWDTHFPDPVWASARRDSDLERLQAVGERLPVLRQTLTAALDMAASHSY